MAQAERKTIKLDAFRSMTSNIRAKTADKCAFSLHFDLFRTGKLTPNRTYTTFTQANELVEKFLYAKNDASGYSVYGLGDDGAGNTSIYEMATGATAWSAFKDGNAAKKTKVFFEYKDALYGWQGTNQLWKCTLTGTPTLTDTFKTIAFTNIAQPVHHKADDVAYFFQDNIVHQLDGSTWNEGAGDPTVGMLTLPSNMKIVGGGAYYNYLAIVCSPIEPGTTNSVMYLWDRDSTLATISDKIDLGFGEVVHVSESEEGGIFITQQVNALTSMGSYNNSIQVKYFVNSSIQSIEIPNGTETEYFSEIKLYANGIEDRNIFYFPAKLVTRLATETKNVIFAVKRTNEGLILTADQNIQSVASGQNINGIYNLNGHWYVSHSTTTVNLVTLNASTYQNATYETVIFNGDDSSVTKKLVGVTIMHSPLPTAGTAKVEYRKDEEASWTTIFTNSTDDSLRHSAVNIESSGVDLPEFKEIQFRLTSGSGAEITGFKFAYDVRPDDIY